VTTDHEDNAARDLIISGRNGLLCSPDDADIAAKVGEILDSSEYADRAEIRKTAAAFDWDAVEAAYEAALFPKPHS
jgi:glycosyltransferase involved in cell wall biosynthesis